MVNLHKRCLQCTGNKFKNPVSCIDRCSYDLSLIYNNEFNFKEVNKYDR